MSAHPRPRRRKVARSCGKRRFRDRIAAEFALANIRRIDRPDARENRSYSCPKCHGWHLTSQPRRERPDTPTARSTHP